jgi:hypothetical protein
MVKNVKQQFEELPEPAWIDDIATVDDIRKMEEEAMKEDPFDILHLRRTLWLELKAKRAELICRSCEYGKVVMVRPIGAKSPPWLLWGRILQAFQIPFTRILFFASPVKRALAKGVGPSCVNGGYTFPCDTRAVVVYREEEATRVLIHELLHAGCTDDMTNTLEDRETKTETFAELFLVAFLSRGSQSLAKKLWAIQAQWISNLNYTLFHDYNVVKSSDYAYRYTVGREEELRRHGIPLPVPRKSKTTSCRFTSAELDKYLTLKN